MKYRIQHTYRSNYSFTFILLLIIISTTNVILSQQEEFWIGAYFNAQTRSDQDYYDKFNEIGLNSMIQRADGTTQSHIGDAKLMADNADNITDVIMHYSTSWYSKWEAEENQSDPEKVGIKHYQNKGTIREFNGRQCWSTYGLSETVDKLIWGPHYHQEKVYKRWYYQQNERYDLKYTPRFVMALDVNDSIQNDEPICKISVVVTYRRWENGVPDPEDEMMVLEVPKTLYASDFQPYGEFKEFYIDNGNNWYDYPIEFRDPITGDKRQSAPNTGVYYSDKWPGHGVEFRLDWLRNDDKCDLYVDYIEVYDNDGWNEYLNPQTHNQVIANIQTYAQNYSGWSNLKYWVGHDEPSSIDAYIPIKTVDDIIQSAFEGAPPMLNNFYPWWEVEVNKEIQLERYYNTVLPNRLSIDFFPFITPYTEARYEDWDLTRELFQICSSLQPGFYYQAQAFGHQKYGGGWKDHRRPTEAEFVAQIMLALAHGVRGINFYCFDSYDDPTNGFVKYGLIDINKQHTDLSLSLKNNVVPRLKGKLGNTLMKLDYTGDYIQSYYEIPSQNPLPDPQTFEYLTLGYGYYTAHNMFWHCGFFNQKNHLDNKYFLLANLYQGAESKTIKVKVTSLNQDYINWRFRNVEGFFDETFTDYIIKDLTHPKGEGYLYQVAPVVLYGGRLLYPESVGGGMVLNDNMVIENGATLTIYDNYIAEANITVKKGTIQVGENGKIIFEEGKKLIIDGVCHINGTSGDKLQLVFSTPLNDDPTGLMIKAGGSLTINNCTIENATIGIQSLLNANYLNVQNVDFMNCTDIAISIAGYSSGQIITPPTPSITYCTISNCGKGISASNLSQIILRENIITGSERGIFLSNVTTPAIIGNHLTGTNQSQGIFLENCNGVVRGNYITSHTNGINLGNSSPDIGGNTIYHNLNRGIYVGTGSLPNMRGKLVWDPLHHIFYAVSGYNKIYENGGWSREDDGSEIFINNANVILAKNGCNEITDQRIPNEEETPPLYNTQLLMNCRGSFQFIEVKAGGNFWDEHPRYRLDERFGDCIVYYEPVLDEPCPQPDGSGGKLIIASASGETIDTLFAEERDVETLTSTEQMYATAEENFLTTDLNGSEILYNQIIDGNDSLNVKLDAYRRLYEIGKLTGKDEVYFDGLRNTYLSLAGVSTDSLMVKTFNQLSTLSLISNQEYVPAINEFDGIIQQNPNTEEAVYAEIDALTTALLIEEADSTLHKGRLGKYLIKSTSDYNEKVDEILRKHFGGESKENEEELLPTEYTLYQNYPNPFNPITTIKYNLPNVSEVSLIIYDILGRKIKELVNTKQQARRYDVQFDASSLASGVYIYQLVAEKFISSKKMILLK